MAKDLTDALAALSDGFGSTTRKNNTLPEAPQLPAIPERAGSAKPKSSGSGGSGIASPLVETAYADRLFHNARTMFTTDGVFPMRVRPIQRISFKDAADTPLDIRYQAPP